MLGRTYLIEHCIYENNRKQKEFAYQVYVTDRLKSINDSVASAFGGMTTQKRYFDLIQMMKEPTEEARTADEIISSISNKLERLNNESV